MGWEYINADTALVKPNRFRFQMVKFSGEAREEITGCSTRAGHKVDDARNPRIGISNPTTHGNNVDIEFQFPPKVLSDGRKGNWFEGDQTGGAEPVAVFKTSGPRELSIAWTYIVDSFNDDSTTAWTIERITRQIRTLRGYFALSRGRKGNRDGLAIMFHMWCIGGDNPISGRIKGVDVKYGETMVFPPGSRSDRAFPLRTDITVDFRLWTKGKEPIISGKDTIAQQDLKKLIDWEPPSWY